MRIHDEDSVRYLTFDRPAVRNAFTADVARELNEELDKLDSTHLDAVVLSGEGDAFSAGGDINAMGDARKRQTKRTTVSGRRSVGSPNRYSLLHCRSLQR